MAKEIAAADVLYEAIVNVKNKETAKDFLDDLLTTSELNALSERVRCAKLFMEGKTYIEVTSETTVSSATLARVSKCVKNGKGYRKVLKKK
ncbi:MAG: YerC/YecD family TrpR-related protein [Bacilli bacterium]|nr:YerC/YecD family TrpR-related protein [Bacilli bacterium]